MMALDSGRRKDTKAQTIKEHVRRNMRVCIFIYEKDLAPQGLRRKFSLKYVVGFFFLQNFVLIMIRFVHIINNYVIYLYKKSIQTKIIYSIKDRWIR